jgi:hypothetical protein
MSPMPPATMNVTAAMSTNGALDSSSEARRVSARTPTAMATNDSTCADDRRVWCDIGPAADDVNNSAQTRKRGQDTVSRHAPRRQHDHADDCERQHQPRPPGPGATRARSPCTTTGRPSTVSGTDHCDALNEPVPM